MHEFRNWVPSIAATVLLAIAGCSAQVASTSIANSQANLDKARGLMAQGNYAEALPLLNSAIGAKGLNSDEYVEALLLRAQSHALSGSNNLADQDVAEAEQGAPSEALIEFTRGILYHTQGKSKESKAAFGRAQRLDRQMRQPDWLR